MIEFYRDAKSIDGLNISLAYHKLDKIVIKPEKILVVISIFTDKEAKIASNEIRLYYTPKDKEFDLLVKSIDTKTKLLGKIKNLIGVE